MAPDEATPLSEYPQAIQEALGFFEAFRKLGYASELIFFVTRVRDPENSGDGIGIQLRSPDPGMPEQILTVFAGELPGVSEGEKVQLWQMAAARWNSSHTPESERDHLWQNSKARQSSVALATELGLRAEMMGELPSDAAN